MGLLIKPVSRPISFMLSGYPGYFGSFFLSLTQLAGTLVQDKTFYFSVQHPFKREKSA
jgi:hypothetical protein